MKVQRACCWVLFCSVALLGIKGASSDGDKSEEDILNRVQEKVLSRKRRYLTFPEGSSLQVVFDQTIPIVGLPLLYTIGVTVAIAYELPSKPWYHYTKEIKENIKNGAYLLRKDQNASQLTYTDQGHKPDISFPSLIPGKTNLLSVAPSYSNYNPSVPNIHSYYYKNGPVYVNPQTPANKQWDRVSGGPVLSPMYYAHPQVTTKLQPVNNKLGYYFGKNPKDQLATLGTQLGQWMKYLPIFKPNQQKPVYWSDVVKGIKQMAAKPKEAFPVQGFNQLPQGSAPIRYGWRRTGKKPVLPVFGKRSIDAHLQKSAEVDLDDYEIELEENLDNLIAQEEEKHFARHHRKTRHELLSKIESYLNSKGIHGRECVLRTLCETGQKDHAQNLPNSFSAEIIKTIFKLPKKTTGEELASEVHVAYDLAHHESTSDDDCADLYPGCESDLWTHPFLY